MIITFLELATNSRLLEAYVIDNKELIKTNIGVFKIQSSNNDEYIIFACYFYKKLKGNYENFL